MTTDNKALEELKAKLEQDVANVKSVKDKEIAAEKARVKELEQALAAKTTTDSTAAKALEDARKALDTDKATIEAEKRNLVTAQFDLKKKELTVHYGLDADALKDAKDAADAELKARDLAIERLKKNTRTVDRGSGGVPNAQYVTPEEALARGIASVKPKGT